LKGIQQGKIEDTFGWNSKVEEVELSNYSTGQTTNGGVHDENVDELP